MAKENPLGTMKGKLVLRRVREILQAEENHQFMGTAPPYVSEEPTLVAIRNRFR